MNAGTTTERVLIVLRRHVMDRDVRPGEKLDPATLAKGLGSSLTPVREALQLLTGEGLVASRIGGGFAIPFLDVRTLQDRYEWCSQILAIAINGWPRRREDQAFVPSDDGYQSVADRCGALFLHIARLSGNAEHARAIERLNSRLHRVRLVEEDVLPGIDGELDELWGMVLGGKRRNILSLCTIYHRRRVKYIDSIVSLMTKNP